MEVHVNAMYRSICASNIQPVAYTDEEQEQRRKVKLENRRSSGTTELRRK
jgi:hypothetical protein